MSSDPACVTHTLLIGSSERSLPEAGGPAGPATLPQVLAAWKGGAVGGSRPLAACPPCQIPWEWEGRVTPEVTGLGRERSSVFPPDAWGSCEGLWLPQCLRCSDEVSPGPQRRAAGPGLMCSLAGIVEVEEGEVNGQELCIASHSIARISFAKEPHVEQVSHWAHGSDWSWPPPAPGLGRPRAPLPEGCAVPGSPLPEGLGRPGLPSPGAGPSWAPLSPLPEGWAVPGLPSPHTAHTAVRSPVPAVCGQVS